MTELQSRELEEGAHLREATVDEHVVEVSNGRLERVTKDDGEIYFRLPESADQIDRGGGFPRVWRPASSPATG